MWSPLWPTRSVDGLKPARLPHLSRCSFIPEGEDSLSRESRMFVQRFQFWQSVQRLLRYSSLDQSSRPDNQHWSAVMIEHGWILGFLSLFNLVASHVFCKALFNIVLIHINSTKAEKYYSLFYKKGKNAVWNLYISFINFKFTRWCWETERW